MYARVYLIAVKLEFAQSVAVLLLSKVFYTRIMMNLQLKFTPQIIKWVKIVLVPVCSCILLGFCYWLTVGKNRPICAYMLRKHCFRENFY